MGNKTQLLLQNEHQHGGICLALNLPLTNKSLLYSLNPQCSCKVSFIWESVDYTVFDLLSFLKVDMLKEVSHLCLALDGERRRVRRGREAVCLQQRDCGQESQGTLQDQQHHQGQRLSLSNQHTCLVSKWCQCCVEVIFMSVVGIVSVSVLYFQPTPPRSVFICDKPTHVFVLCYASVMSKSFTCVCIASVSVLYFHLCWCYSLTFPCLCQSCVFVSFVQL